MYATWCHVIRGDKKENEQTIKRSALWANSTWLQSGVSTTCESDAVSQLRSCSCYFNLILSQMSVSPRQISVICEIRELPKNCRSWWIEFFRIFFCGTVGCISELKWEGGKGWLRGRWYPNHTYKFQVMGYPSISRRAKLEVRGRILNNFYFNFNVNFKPAIGRVSYSTSK